MKYRSSSSATDIGMEERERQWTEVRENERSKGRQKKINK
jgi:hypothetical protein